MPRLCDSLFRSNCTVVLHFSTSIFLKKIVPQKLFRYELPYMYELSCYGMMPPGRCFWVHKLGTVLHGQIFFRFIASKL
jgi:hypothetical protein